TRKYAQRSSPDPGENKRTSVPAYCVSSPGPAGTAITPENELLITKAIQKMTKQTLIFGFREVFSEKTKNQGTTALAKNYSRAQELLSG
ncbi:MAG: hypothetical protein ACK5AM_12245, partial [Pirellulaceae bacterium]